MSERCLFERIGGADMLNQVHETFYDKIFADPWLSQYFQQRPRDHLIRQQTSYFTQLMGGPKRYCGHAPNNAHQFMMITEELFDLRSKYLAESILEHGFSEEIKDEWVAMNDVFKPMIIKKSLADCKKLYSHQEILNFPKPH